MNRQTRESGYPAKSMESRLRTPGIALRGVWQSTTSGTNIPQFRPKQQGVAILTRRSICLWMSRPWLNGGIERRDASKYSCLPVTTVADDRRYNPYTAQVPPNPMLTLPLSTMTGTSLAPFENSNIRSIAFLSFLTSTYVNGTFFLA